MPEWRPGVLEGLLSEIGTRGQASLNAGLHKIAAAIEAEAKADLAKNSHAYGTPTTAGKGRPPALVTGTGRRSIGHQYIREGVSSEMRVGTHAGVYPPAELSRTNRGSRSRATAGTTGSRGRTPSSKYLWYQETLGRFDHPFLVPAFKRVISADGVRIWLEAFKMWPRI